MMFSSIQKLIKKPCLAGVYSCPENHDKYSRSSLRVLIDNLHLNNPISIFISYSCDLELSNYKDQIVLDKCFLFKKGKKSLVALQIPRTKKDIFITVFSHVENKAIFSQKITPDTEFFEDEQIWSHLPNIKNFAFLDLHACEQRIARDESNRRTVSAYFLKPRNVALDDICVSTTDVTEVDESYPTGGIIGEITSPKNLQDCNVLYISQLKGCDYCSIKFEVPRFKKAVNYNIQSKQGQFISRIAFPSIMAENCLQNYLIVNRTVWDINVNPSETLSIKTDQSSSTSQNIKLSLIVPLWNTPEEYLCDLLKSIENQTYKNWELVLVNASPDNEEVAGWLGTNATDKRIKILTLDSNLGIARNTLAGIKEATGNFVCMLDHDDFLAEDALQHVANAINNDEGIDALFSDEDYYEDGKLTKPIFKTPLNKALLLSKNYAGHFLCVNRELFLKIAIDEDTYDGSQDYFILLELLRNNCKIARIPNVLYHWRASETSVALDSNAKSYLETTSLAVLNNYMSKTNMHAKAELSELKAIYKLDWEKPENLSVTLITNQKHSNLEGAIADLNITCNLKFTKTFDWEHIAKELKKCRDGVIIISSAKELYETSGLEQMICRAYWQNEILSPISVSDLGWIKDAGFERTNSGDLQSRQTGRHIFHPGYLCVNFTPLNVDALSYNMMVLNKKTSENLKYQEGKIFSDADLTVIPDVQVVSYQDSKPFILASQKTSACFNPELDAFNKKHDLL